MVPKTLYLSIDIILKSHNTQIVIKCLFIFTAKLCCYFLGKEFNADVEGFSFFFLREDVDVEVKKTKMLANSNINILF